MAMFINPGLTLRRIPPCLFSSNLRAKKARQFGHVPLVGALALVLPHGDSVEVAAARHLPGVTGLLGNI